MITTRQTFKHVLKPQIKRQFTRDSWGKYNFFARGKRQKRVRAKRAVTRDASRHSYKQSTYKKRNADGADKIKASAHEEMKEVIAATFTKSQ